MLEHILVPAADNFKNVLGYLKACILLIISRILLWYEVTLPGVRIYLNHPTKKLSTREVSCHLSGLE